MSRRLLSLGVAALVFVPGAVFAQGFGVGVRGGTIGIGAEGAVGLGDNLVVRGGLGLMPLEVDASSFWDPGQDVTANLELPKTWYNIGADLYLGGSFRLGAGMLFKPDDPTVTGSLSGTATIEIGGQTYTASDVAEVVGTLDSKDQAPYFLLGFGKHTSGGFGLFLDLGVALLGDPEVTLEATKGNPTVTQSSQFQSRLREEETNIEDDVGSYLKLWPIVNIGLRLGIG